MIAQLIVVAVLGGLPPGSLSASQSQQIWSCQTGGCYVSGQSSVYQTYPVPSGNCYGGGAVMNYQSRVGSGCYGGGGCYGGHSFRGFLEQKMVIKSRHRFRFGGCR